MNLQTGSHWQEHSLLQNPAFKNTAFKTTIADLILLTDKIFKRTCFLVLHNTLSLVIQKPDPESCNCSGSYVMIYLFEVSLFCLRWSVASCSFIPIYFGRAVLMTASIFQTHSFNPKIKNTSQFSWERDCYLGCHICHLEAVCGTEVSLKYLTDITVVTVKFLVERWDICYCNFSATLNVAQMLGKIHVWHPDDFLPFYSALDILGNTMREGPVMTQSLRYMSL